MFRIPTTRSVVLNHLFKRMATTEDNKTFLAGVAQGMAASTTPESKARLYEAIKGVNDALEGVFNVPILITNVRLFCSFSISMYCLFFLNDVGSSWTVAWFYSNAILTGFIFPAFHLGGPYPNARIPVCLLLLFGIAIQNTLIFTAPLILLLGAGDAKIWIIILWIGKIQPFVSKLFF